MNGSEQQKEQEEQFNLSDAPLRKGDVLVLGAGFSRALTDKAPVMSGFLAKSVEEGAYQPAGHDIELAKVLFQYFGGKLGDVNIEELATLLADESSEDWPSIFNRRAAYDQLIWVITNTLSAVWDGAKKSPSLPFARSLAQKCVAERVPIVTLNYDLIIDNLLHETKQWNPDFGYGARLQTPFDEFFETVDKQIPGSSMPLMNPSTLLLKLHGSLNWGIRKAPHPDGTHPVEILSSDKLELLSRRGGATVDLPPLARQIRPISSTPYGPGLPGNPTMRFDPLIVPPYSQKQTGSQHALITYCWYLAREILVNAKRIVVAGYSLPPADFSIRNIFREAMGTLHRPGQDVTIMIINPDADVTKRFRDLFASFSFVKVVLSYTDCAEWLRNASGSDPVGHGMEYPTGGLDLSKPVYSRPDSTYVVSYNGLPYHVIQGDPLFAQVKEYDKQHPGAVQPEPTS